MEFTETSLVPNNMDRDGDPLLSLGYIDDRGKAKAWNLGASKAYQIMAKYDEIGEALANHKPEDGIFTYLLVLNAGAPWASDFIITRQRFAMLEFFKDEIEKYIDKYYVPFTRETIDAPFSKQEERDLGVVWNLYVPCYEQDNGFAPWRVTEFVAGLLVRDGMGGKVYAEMKKHAGSGTKDDFVFTHTIKGEQTKFSYKIEQVNAFIKYYDDFIKFALNPTSLVKE